ncbi:MAG TPA: winged helix-turn-helix domain-containing protein, partial [Candidatus Acidoferrum sp.]
MAISNQPKAPVRFGVFEVDIIAGELRKNGLRLRLPAQPFQVLAILLERPGEVVTREELRERLWPGDTFVDFDHSLSTAINKIREALSDSAENPRFVETRPRRGYRFIAPVTTIERVRQFSGQETVATPETRTIELGAREIE